LLISNAVGWAGYYYVVQISVEDLNSELVEIIEVTVQREDGGVMVDVIPMTTLEKFGYTWRGVLSRISAGDPVNITAIGKSAVGQSDSTTDGRQVLYTGTWLSVIDVIATSVCNARASPQACKLSANIDMKAFGTVVATEDTNTAPIIQGFEASPAVARFKEEMTLTAKFEDPSPSLTANLQYKVVATGDATSDSGLIPEFNDFLECSNAGASNSAKSSCVQDITFTASGCVADASSCVQTFVLYVKDSENLVITRSLSVTVRYPNLVTCLYVFRSFHPLWK
jgi:hypothetical protein